MAGPTKQEQELLNTILSPEFKYDPVRFVRFAYPWGVPGTPLERFSGLRKWQEEELQDFGDYVLANAHKERAGEALDRLKKATAAGRGIGKSALLGMAAHWVMSCFPGSTTLIAANSEPQLRTTTFPEVRQWFAMAINAHWFEREAMSIKPAAWFQDLLAKQLGMDSAYYYVQGKLWTEENPSAFAGPHSQTGMVLLWDEASGVPSSLVEVAEYYFIDAKNPLRIFAMYSNPRANSGAFFDAFHKLGPDGKPFWKLRQIDSRTVEDSDPKLVADKIAEHGIDSDVVRVEVLGQFPLQGQDQFIANSFVHDAQQRQLVTDPGAPLIMGVDIARHGNDFSVVRFRQGPDARSIPSERWQVNDLAVSADRVAKLMDEYRPDAVCIDIGMGAGVADILRRRNYRTTLVDFGSSSGSPEWANKRTELYAKVREWLRMGCLDSDPRVFHDLTTPSYGFHGKEGTRVILEPKEKFKSRLGRSPDDGDALALTFAVDPARRDNPLARAGRRSSVARGVDYPIFG